MPTAHTSLEIFLATTTRQRAAIEAVSLYFVITLNIARRHFHVTLLTDENAASRRGQDIRPRRHSHITGLDTLQSPSLCYATGRRERTASSRFRVVPAFKQAPIYGKRDLRQHILFLYVYSASCFRYLIPTSTPTAYVMISALIANLYISMHRQYDDDG